jgi:hypothetical protein
MRLYDNFQDAITGEEKNAIPLIAWPDRQNLTMKTRGDTFTPLARIISYDFTTERETISTDHLGAQFKEQYEAGLISGQGTIDCFWEHQYRICDDNVCASGVEFPAYLAQLCVRLTQGADFFGRFFVFRGTNLNENSVWYESECVVTSCSIEVDPSQAITSTIQFVTTAEFKLLTGLPPSYLTQENNLGLILQEDGTSKLVLAE